MASQLQKASTMRTRLACFLTVASLALPSLAQAQELPSLVPSIPLDGASSASATTAEKPATEWNSPALAVTGTVVAGLGVAATTVGAFIYLNDECADDDAGLYPCMNFGEVIGGITMLGGGGLILIGAPMIVAGAWQVESKDRGIPPTTAELKLGPARADLAIAF